MLTNTHDWCTVNLLCNSRKLEILYAHNVHENSDVHTLYSISYLCCSTHSVLFNKLSNSNMVSITMLASDPPPMK